ncbi:hypothetical protein H072_746 [Dactylellina haptotyla CBS 200.50]|uniref:4Fe-4S ferredoxin-type domain-containing protein n=1 Tax=Dactylellina haptotyla (strain CBS 200.50) TaxID=1284197 RepID=S8CC22_DACHA|nr:hypothetical protein H072_746 [Dactylellina haptotyla CBS 200.50]
MKASTISLVFSVMALGASAATDQCSTTQTPDCEYLCPSNGNRGNATEWKCTPGAQIPDKQKCVICPLYTVCPAKWDPECPYTCKYESYNDPTGFCAYVNVSTQGSVCHQCPGNPNATTTTGSPSPPAQTGAASNLQIGSAAIGGFIALLLATF